MISRSLPSIAFFSFGVFLIYYSHVTLNDFKDIGAAFMPTIAGAGLIFFALIDFTLSFKNKTKTKTNGDFKYISLIVILVIFYMILSDYLGFIITGTIITAPLMMKFSNQKNLNSFLISFFIVLLIYYIFAKILLVPLPHIMG